MRMPIICPHCGEAFVLASETIAEWRSDANLLRLHRRGIRVSEIGRRLGLPIAEVRARLRRILADEETAEAQAETVVEASRSAA